MVLKIPIVNDTIIEPIPNHKYYALIKVHSWVIDDTLDTASNDTKYVKFELNPSKPYIDCIKHIFNFLLKTLNKIKDMR
jgi:hypothetical protein